MELSELSLSSLVEQSAEEAEAEAEMRRGAEIPGRAAAPHVVLHCNFGSCNRVLNVPQQVYREALELREKRNSRVAITAASVRRVAFSGAFVSPEGYFYCSGTCFNEFCED